MKEGIIVFLCVIVLYLCVALFYWTQKCDLLKTRAIESNCAKYIVDEKTGATKFIFKGEEGWIE